MSLLLCLALLGCSAPTALQDSTGAGETASSADAFVNSIGTNVHLSYFTTPYGTGWATVVKPKLLALGIRHLRDAGSVTTDDSWMRTVYGRMKELSDQGIKFNLIMKPELNVTDYSHLDHFSRLLQYAAPVVESFEGLNEHDISNRVGWAQEVREFQQALYEAVRQDSRTATLPVYGPSMAHPNNATAVGNLRSYMDYGAIHPYPGGDQPMTKVEYHSQKTQVINGNRPLAATETGYHTAGQWTGEHPAVTEQAMARYIARLFLEYFNAGIKRTYLYELIDEGSHPAQREENFGLLRNDGSEKPGYATLRNLIGLLADAGPAFTPGRLEYRLSDHANLRHTLLQKRDGRFYLALWQNTSSMDVADRRDLVVSPRTITVTLANTAAAVRLFDPLRSASATGQFQSVDTIPVAVLDSPTILEITP